MNRILIFSINIILLLKLKQIESGNPEDVSEDTTQYMSKDEVLAMLQDSVRSIIESDSSSPDDNEHFKRYFKMVKSLGYCMSAGDIKKQELVSCLNTIIGEVGVIPPVPFMTCLGEYVMCTSRSCFSTIQSKKTNSKAVKCLVKCLPNAVLCISRSGPVPKRYKGV